MRVVEAIGSPWRIAKRGRKPKFKPELHAAICIYLRCFNLTYRDAEGEMPLLISQSIDHSTIGWAMQRVPVDYVSKALKLLHVEINSLLFDGMFIADSTGIETDRYEGATIVLSETKRREFRKLHVIVDYFHRHGIISIASAGESSGNAHDSPAFRQIFDPEVCSNGLLLGDRAYDALENFKLAYENNLHPVIKLRDYQHSARTKGIRIRRRATRDFDKLVYKQFRGIVEGVFGGMETRYGNATRCRLRHTSRVSIMLMALAHNIRAYARAIALVEIVRKEERVSCEFYFLFDLFDNPSCR
ncbi:MAG: transposase [Methanobacteriota archaeon]